MDINVIVNRVVRDMKLQGLITVDEYGNVREGETKVLVMAAAVGAWEERGRILTAHNEKEVCQFTSEMTLIKRYRSVKDASVRLKIKSEGIYSALERGNLTRRGYYWKYAENGNDNKK